MILDELFMALGAMLLGRWCGMPRDKNMLALGLMLLGAGIFAGVYSERLERSLSAEPQLSATVQQAVVRQWEHDTGLFIIGGTGRVVRIRLWDASGAAGFLDVSTRLDEADGELVLSRDGRERKNWGEIQ